MQEPSQPGTSDDAGSVTRWIHELKVDEVDVKDQAQHNIYYHFFDRLAALARTRMPVDARREADDEDVVQSAYDSFFRRMEDGHFLDLQDRSALWALLAKITMYKASRQVTRERAAKRGQLRVVRESDLPVGQEDRLPTLDELAKHVPDAEFEVEMQEQLESLFGLLSDPVLRQVAELKFLSYQNKEIAEKLGIGLRSVERKIARIRSIWLEAVMEN